MTQPSPYEIHDFTKDVLERSHIVPVLVDFWAEWCGPCKILGPVLERLATSNDDRWVLAKVDTEEHQDIAASYGIRSIPNVKLFVDGAVTDEFVGALPEYAVRKWLETAVPDKYRKELDAADDLIHQAKTDEARAALESILAKEPTSERARVLLSRLKIFDDPARALALIGGIEEHSSQYPLADALRTIGALLSAADQPPGTGESDAAGAYRDAIRMLTSQDFEGALQNFIDVIRKDRSIDNDGARRACIAIFRFLGDEHPVTQQFRRAFSSALY